MVLLPINWEKGVQDSRVQGFKGMFFNDFIFGFQRLFNIPDVSLKF